MEPLSGADDIYAVAINDAGNIAGTSGNDAFFWKNGNMTICGNLCDDQTDGASVATAINNNNQVVGYATNDDGETHAFIWQYEDGESVITDLGTLGGDNSWALAINDSGVVIGYSETGDTYEAGSLATDIYHTCAWYEGAIYDLGVLEAGELKETLDAIENQSYEFDYSRTVFGSHALIGGEYFFLMAKFPLSVALQYKYALLQSVDGDEDLITAINDDTDSSYSPNDLNLSGHTFSLSLKVHF